MLQRIYLNLISPFISIFQTIKNKSNYWYFFLIIPIIYYVNTIFIHLAYGDFYYGVMDPEYLHLFNGIAIAMGNLSVEYTAHPGTPLEFLMAIAARIVNFFSGDRNLVRDFINNPEKYLHAANFLQNLIIALILYAGAKYIAKSFGNYTLGFLFQLVPFANSSLLGITGRILPETIMVVSLLAVIVLIIREINTESHINIKKELALWGVIIGFGIACKLSFFPVFILPLILIQAPVKKKALFIVYLTLAVMLFAYPVVLNFQVFREWVIGIFTHTGMHGIGGQGVIDMPSLMPNLKYLYSRDKLLFVFMFLSSIVLLLNFLQNILLNKHKAIKITRAIISVNITLVLTILFTLKHFAFHYFIPFYVFKFMLLILVLMYLNNLRIVIELKNIKRGVAFLFVFGAMFIVFLQSNKLGVRIVELEERANSRSANKELLISKVNPDSPVIITAPYYGSPFMQYACNEGFMMTFKVKGCFRELLKEKYPKSFIYVSWSDNFLHWEEQVDFNFIFERAENEFYLYLGGGKEKVKTIVEGRLYDLIDKELIDVELILYYKEKGESLYKYTLKSNKTFKSYL